MKPLVGLTLLGLLCLMLAMAFWPNAAKPDGIYNPTANGIGVFGNSIANFKVAGGGGGGCDQTGLDFTLNCNMILIPALIH